MERRILAISFLVSIIITSSIVAPGAFAQKGSADEEEEVNGPGGLMSLIGVPHHNENLPSDPLQIKEHHPAHIKKFIGPALAPSAVVVYAPANVWTAYGFSSLTCTQTTTSSQGWQDPNLCGHGQTIAIVDAFDDPNIASDLNTFDSQWGLPACTVANGCFVKSAPAGIQTDSGWALEISLDVEWAHSIAPGAKIVLVETSNNSLGSLLGGEDTAVAAGAQQVSNSWGGSEFSSESAYDYHFNSGTASFFVASGDSGHGAEYPAASPYVISVGGTTLNTDSSWNWLSETAWSGSGGGASAYESKPSYQNNFVSGNSRAIPDVAYNADPNTGVYVYDSFPINGQSGWWQVGGTSAGAPQWAALTAIANSQGATLSSANYGTSNAFYGAATGAPTNKPYTSNYHDITSGSNGNCGSACTAGPGYDEVTGLGSPQANNLISSLSAPPAPDFTVASSPSSLTINAGSSGTSSITISSVNSFSGAVTLSASAQAGFTATLQPSSVSVSSGSPGSSTLTITTPSTAAGTYSVTVTAQGPSSTHSTTVTVTVPTVSSPPQNLVASGGSTQVSLLWQAPASNGGSAITSYNIYRSTTMGGEGSTPFKTGITSTSYTDIGLTNGQTYYYQVTAVNGVGESAKSSEASATPNQTPTLSVSVSTDKSSYTRSSYAHISVTVTSGTPVSGASVTLKVTNPNGGTSQGTGTTNSNGQVTFTYHISKYATYGTYTATATAAKSGYLSGSGSATFQVAGSSFNH